MFIYIIIGIIICTYGCCKLVERGRYTEEELLTNPSYLLGIVLIVIGWPVLVVLAVYETIKESREEEL